MNIALGVLALVTLVSLAGVGLVKFLSETAQATNELTKAMEDDPP